MNGQRRRGGRTTARCTLDIVVQFIPPPLRKTLFLVMDSLIKTMPQGDPVYEFMNKKRSQGKPYYVYMTAGANKFLRIYYGRVKEYLSEHPETAVN